MKLKTTKAALFRIAFVQLLVAATGTYIVSYSAAKPPIANIFLFLQVIIFPVAYYFQYVKKYNIRKLTMLLYFSFCCLVAYVSLPEQQKGYIIQLRKLSVLAELGILIYFFTKIKQIRKQYGYLQNNFADEAYNIKNSITAVLGNRLIFRMLSTELWF
jgi:O-antigen ligase